MRPKSLVFKSEEEMARVIVAWLRDQEWTVYQEVQIYDRGRCADIVAKRGNVILVIECKLRLNLDVIGQAQWWSHESNYAFVGTTPGRRHALLDYLCRDLGIGILHANEYGVTEFLAPQLRRRCGSHLRDGLVEAQIDFAAAGNARNERWSPWKQTARELAGYVSRRPGCPLKELIGGIKHHYSSSVSARSALAKWITLGKIPGVEIRHEGRRVLVYPVTT